MTKIWGGTAIYFAYLQKKLGGHVPPRALHTSRPCSCPTPSNQNPGAATGTTSTLSLCTAYYTKITLLNNLKLTVLLMIVNVQRIYYRNSFARAHRLICRNCSISKGLQLHNITQCTCVRVFSRTAQCSSVIIRVTENIVSTIKFYRVFLKIYER